MVGVFADSYKRDWQTSEKGYALQVLSQSEDGIDITLRLNREAQVYNSELIQTVAAVAVAGLIIVLLLYWYLKHTQDMPNTIEDEVSRRVGRLGKLYDQLALFIDAELGGGGFEQISDEDIPSDDQHYDFFTTQGEKDVEHSQEEYLQPEAYPDPDEDEGETPDIK